MIDCHAHILPSVDDGPTDMAEVIDMLRQAVDDGIRTIVGTSHASERTDVALLRDGYKRVVEAASGLPIEILFGAEILASPVIPELLTSSALPTLNDSRFPLIEFDFAVAPPSVESILFNFQLSGYRPVVAHVERYAYVQRNPSLMRSWPRYGAILQVNAGSFRGEFGNAAMASAWELAESDWPVIAASDAHDCTSRSPRLRDAFDLVVDRRGRARAELMFERLPMAIIRNAEIEGLGDSESGTVGRTRRTQRRWWHNVLGR